MIVHGFAGIGWSEALPPGTNEIGLELNTAACRTRINAGHTTIQCDVTQYPTWVFKGRRVKKIDSPPCPGFGKSGKKLGLLDLPRIHQAIDDLSRGKDTRAAIGAACLDWRSILTAEPMRWHYDLQPEAIAMEQVPSVLPVWEQYAEILRRWGYSVATGVLDAADHGLGQNRRRAVIIASRLHEVALPPRTHGGLGQPAHVSMADTIGWGYTQRPAPTVTGGGTATGGAEPFGNGTRQAMRRVIGTPLWRDRGVPNLRPTVAECAALQGFRPGLVFHGGAGEQHLIVGNAVAVPFADALLQAAGITQPAHQLAAA
ncbi:DNA cytosine methyltransferase [Streptomyces sp. NBC_00338]|uniref:DNA cytosine methyltransferase n=1 Tax=Streptomyces sp. NBC_00338 TaxID=2975715 RepID=UPI002254A2E1|nr:DNA cytosine methyltransferase [Streptomyces sp. NBC_00338]MCX5138356.1 DNA cytosine methyltransferase [Streptomyces sp. NBC_00338]MCX5145145.1 DNA cytosine methyltransferase [Streptomyces sp. NBC_00338]